MVYVCLSGFNKQRVVLLKYMELQVSLNLLRETMKSSIE